MPSPELCHHPVNIILTSQAQEGKQSINEQRPCFSISNRSNLLLYPPARGQRELNDTQPSKARLNMDAANGGGIASVMREVQHQTERIEASEDLDSWLDNESGGKLRQREKQSAEELKRALEAEFLTPSPRFSAEWLNRLQRCVRPTMYRPFASVLLSRSHLPARAFGIAENVPNIVHLPNKADGMFL
jgi:hypothetical protein